MTQQSYDRKLEKFRAQNEEIGFGLFKMGLRLLSTTLGGALARSARKSSRLLKIRRSWIQKTSIYFWQSPTQSKRPPLGVRLRVRGTGGIRFGLGCGWAIDSSVDGEAKGR